MQHNGPWLYGVASMRDLSVSNRDEPRGGEMQLVLHHRLAMTYEPLLGHVDINFLSIFKNFVNYRI